MRAPLLTAALIALGLSQAQAQTVGPVDPGAPVDAGRPKSVSINGVEVRVRPTPGASQGYMVPDAEGGYLYYGPGPVSAPPSPDRADAEEIRLYAKELAAQITGGLSGSDPLFGLVSVPSAFVDQDSGISSSFGRLMGEQMTYELAGQGFPVKEMRGVAAPKAKSKTAPRENLAVLAGSYYTDPKNLFVNARLVEPSGRVVRTASVLIPMTPTLRRMLGLSEPSKDGYKPVLPTIISARDVSEPPSCSTEAATPYYPTAKKRPSAPKKVRVRKAKVQNPCPPGCEPVETKPPAPQGKKAAPEAAPAKPK